MGERDAFYGPFRQPYYPSDQWLGLSPKVFDIKFTHANYLQPDEPRIELSTFKHGNYVDGSNMGPGKVPVVTMPWSDMPGFILRPLDGGKGHVDQVVVMNSPVWVDPVDYIVLPLHARYLDTTLEAAAGSFIDWSGQSTVAGTQLFDYVNQRVFIGVGHPRQDHCPWHYSILRQVDGVANGTTTETVKFPLIWDPYSIHRQESLYNRRRNCKVTQLTIALATAQLQLHCYDEGATQIDTRTINLNVAKIQQDIFGDAQYLAPFLYVLGAAGVIYADTQFFIG